MHLNKAIANTVGGKTAPEPSAKNVSTAKTAPAQAAKSSASAPPAVPRSVSSLIAAAGLPADKLSASIISFARFFSLSMKPEMLAAIRRQAFSQPAASQTAAAAQADTAQAEAAPRTAAEGAPGLEAAAKNREAFSLAAAAAESKGVELQSKGLETFAEAVDPDWQRRQEQEGHERGRRNKNQNERKDENAPQKTGGITAAGLEKMALESAEKDTLLAMLNKLPGKNGQRWIVLPFSFRENGRDFKVSIRILLDTEQVSNCAVCMALDIAESGETESSAAERRRLFVLEAANDHLSRLAVYLQHELSPKAHSSFIRELSHLLGIKSERISVKKQTESFPCESGCGDELLRSIDEAV